MVKMKWRNYLFWWSSQPKLISGFLVLWALLGLAVVGKGQTYCEDKPKILYYRRGQAALVGGSASDEVANHVVISNVNKEFLACVSSRNVEWVYDGEGEPSKFQESSTVDIQKYEDNSISYCLTSQITFYNKQSDTELSRHTGRYLCREIGNVSNTASVYLFASRKNSPTFLQSRKTLMLPLSAANITMISMRDDRATNESTGNGSSPEYNKTAQTRAFTIPCVTTRPDVTAKLFKKGRNNKFIPFTGVAHQFDPKYGFQLKASTTTPDDLSEFHGEYKCVSSPMSRTGSGGGKSIEDELESVDFEDFVLISLVKAKTLKFFPAASEVYTSGMLNLTCESEEPVIMKEVLPPSAQDIYSYLDEDDYERDRSDDIVETTEKTEQKSHIANYMEILPAPGRTGEIQCLSEKTGKVLHTWRYRIIRKRADKLSGIKFNKREQSFTCKSKLGAPGRLSFVSCRTPSECRINKNCLLKSENCRGYSNSTRAFCERKSHFCGKIFYKGGSGLIRCIGEGIDEIRGFSDESLTDQAVRMGFGKLKASETALLQLADAEHRLSAEGQGSAAKPHAQTIFEGESVNVTLRMGYYFFLYPVQWTAKFKNGSTVQINAESQNLQVDRLTRTVLASITLPYTSATKFVSVLNNTSTSTNNNSTETLPNNADETGKQSSPQLSEIVALNVLIPLRSSVDPSWKTVTLPLTVYGKEGLLQPPADPESEEVLVEPPLNNRQSESEQPSAGNKSPSDKSSTAGDVEVPNEDDNDEDENENDEDEDEEEQQEAKITATSVSQPTSEPIGGSVSIESKISQETSSSSDNSHSGLNVTRDETEVIQENDVDQKGNATTTPSSTLSSSPSPAVVVSNSPNLTSSSPSDSEDDLHSHEPILDTAQDETFLARSGLLDDDDIGDSEAQAETQHANRIVSEVGGKVETEPVPTTGLPISFNSDEVITSSNVDGESVDIETTTWTAYLEVGTSE